MYIQAYASPNIKTAYLPTFKRKERDEDYFAYMSRHSDEILGASVMVGSLSGAVVTKKNRREDTVYTMLRHIGTVTLGLFGLTSLSYFLPENVSGLKK